MCFTFHYFFVKFFEGSVIVHKRLKIHVSRIRNTGFNSCIFKGHDVIDHHRCMGEGNHKFNLSSDAFSLQYCEFKVNRFHLVIDPMESIPDVKFFFILVKPM